LTEDLRLELLPAEGPILDQILAATFDIWHDGLNPAGYRRYYSAQRGTAWGRSHLHRWALVGAGEVLASAKVYDLAAVLDGRPIRVVGLGAVFTQPAHRGRGCARTLIDRLLERSPARDVMMIRPLTAAGTPDRPLGGPDVFYWQGDQF
jgi:GNAT superfamily N-acetyltransferase